MHIFFMHIMKTAGTSFRNLLEESLGEALFPTVENLHQRNNRYYYSAIEMLDLADELESRQVICGHLPYSLAETLGFGVATFLREPVSRTLSMLRHRRQKSPKFAAMSVREMLSHPFVEKQVRDYQSKYFAVPHKQDVNLPFSWAEKDFDRAKRRLAQTEFVGITEYFDESLDLFTNRTGLELPAARRLNVTENPIIQPSEYELDLIRQLVARDLELYELAKKLFWQRVNSRFSAPN